MFAGERGTGGTCPTEVTWPLTRCIGRSVRCPGTAARPSSCAVRGGLITPDVYRCHKRTFETSSAEVTSGEWGNGSGREMIMRALTVVPLKAGSLEVSEVPE